VRGPTWPGSASASSTGSSVCDGAARVRCGGDVTGAREAAGESTAGPHWRVDGGAAELVGVDGGAQAARQFGGDLRGTTVERVSAAGTTRERGAAYSPARRTG
jgi:hypothetical protein